MLQVHSLFPAKYVAHIFKQKEFIAVRMPSAYLMVFQFLSTVAQNCRYDRMKYNVPCFVLILSSYHGLNVKLKEYLKL